MIPVQRRHRTTSSSNATDSSNRERHAELARDRDRGNAGRPAEAGEVQRKAEGPDEERRDDEGAHLPGLDPQPGHEHDRNDGEAQER